MKIRSTKSFLAILIAAVMVLTAFAGIATADTATTTGIQGTETLNNDLFESHDKLTIMVRVEGETAYQLKNSVKGIESVSAQLLNKQLEVEKQIEAVLEEQIDVTNNYVLLFNGFAFDGEYWMIDEINKNVAGVLAYSAPVFDVPKPMLSTSTGIIGADSVWDLEYTGEGMAVAIIDTGILLSHKMFSIAPENQKIDQEYLSAVVAQYGNLMHSGGDVSQLYKSEKVPFGYNYYGNNYNPGHPGSSDHGTHVAGIAAGNNGTTLKGVAYDAQIIAMQVFQPSGGASYAQILAALEDCAYLGVDAANMSLGSPAGFTNAEAYGHDMAVALELIDEMGVNLAVSSGNEGSTAASNAWNGYQPATDPDAGLTGSPGSFAESLSVASSDNASLLNGYLQVGDRVMGYSDRATATSDQFITLAGEHEYVVVPSNGYPENYENIDVAGKIALVTRGDITFTEKVANAAAAGAIGIIIYNNQDGVINMQVDNYVIPAVSIIQEYGQFLIANAGDDGVGNITVCADEFLDYSAAADISSFSSIGTTADLKIKPEITAPGGNIYSSTSPAISGEEYQSWSGTSMSSPHVCGAMAIVKQYVLENFPNADVVEVKNIINAILMCTATQLEEEMVRAQGAGLVNLLDAVTTNAYLTVPTNVRPKLELDDSEDGSWTFTVTVNNFGDNEITYEVDVQTLTETPALNGMYARQWYFLTNGTPYDVSAFMDVTAPETVTVPAGASVDVNFTIAATEELQNFCDVYFTAGMFLEGFVNFIAIESEEGVKDVDLSAPFLGYLGDWDYPSMFDNYFYYEAATGMDDTMSNSAIPFNFVGYNRNDGVGLNPYADMTGHTFNPDWGAVSANGDSKNENVTYARFGLVRNARTLNVYVTDANGQLLDTLYEAAEYQWRKEYFNDTAGAYTYSDLTFNLNPARYSEGQTVYVTIEANLDHDEYDPDANECGKWVTPVTFDTTAPTVSFSNGVVSVLDSHYVAYYAVFSDANFTNCLDVGAGFEMERNTAVNSANVSGHDTLYVLAADYAQNEAWYSINTATGAVTPISGPGEGGGGSTGEIYYENDFETSSDVSGILLLDYDGDGELWGWYNEPEVVNEGTRSLGSQSFQIAAPDNWLIFPLTIPEDATWGFHYMAMNGVGEHMSLYVAPASAVNGNQVSLNLFEEIYSEDVDNAAFENMEVDLSAYAGYAYVAIRHHDCGNGTYLFVDTMYAYTGDMGGGGGDGFVYPVPNSATTFPTADVTIATAGATYPAAGTYEVECGTRMTVFAYPEEGQLVSATINGQTVEALPGIDGEWYVTTEINADTTFEISYYQPTVNYNVNITSTGNGTTNPTGEITVAGGSELPITLIPDEGYLVSSVLVNGVECVDDVIDNVITITVDADTTVNVTFVQTPKTGAVALTAMAIMAMVSGAGIVIFKKN